MSHIVVFQGDSITDGNRTKDSKNFWDLNHYLGHGYAQMVAARLGADFPDKDFKFHNRGVSGNRILDMYARWREDAICLMPNTISILIGVNDCGAEINNHSGSRIDKYERIYRMMLDETRQALPGVNLVLMEPFILPVGSIGEKFAQWQELIVPQQQILPKIAEDYNAAYVPLQEKFNKLCEKREASYWLWDGVHPTAAGHEIIARQWVKAYATLNVI